MIPVTRPSMPNRKLVQSYLDGIYERKWLTNNGPLLKELTVRLEEYLGVENLLLVANGTLALQLAYKVLRLKEQVITTPFTFIATASSLNWGGVKPRFSDIDSRSFNLCPLQVEHRITPQTQAVVPVHVYGNPCNVEAFERLAKRYDLKIIYDAAHAFGVRYKGKSLLNWGDASVLSFHATKLFHTVEGGAVVFNNEADYERARAMINFGINDSGKIVEKGINAKLSEVHAAFGLALLDNIDDIMERRVELQNLYIEELNDYVQLPEWSSNATLNGAYLPVLFASKKESDRVESRLNSERINPRRYFSPSLDTIPQFFEQESVDLAISRSVSMRILCLPLYDGLAHSEVKRICKLIKDVLR
ncbi:DegT/DnrJ/EryC1/StrS family aminotransferase [Porticoccus sp. GXU_MW_L64]